MRPTPEQITTTAHQLVELVRRPARKQQANAPADGQLTPGRETPGKTVELIPNGIPSNSHGTVMGTGSGSYVPGQEPVPR